MHFRTEKELFDTAIHSAYFQQLCTAAISIVEPKGLFGVPDLVVAHVKSTKRKIQIRKTFAFEMKLCNWQRALIQAYKYRSFAVLSYVVLDQRYVRRATKSLARFQSANIGLLGVDTNGDVTTYHQPVPDRPYSIQATVHLHALVRQHCGPIPIRD